MNRVGIYIKNDTEESVELAQKALSTLAEYDIEAVLLSRQIPDTILEDVERFNEDAFFKDTDCIIVFGGDGTLLSVARRAAPYQTPLFGINAGKLGFLTEGEARSYKDLIGKLICGEVTSDDRTMLVCRVLLSEGREETFLALNDIVIRNTAMRLMKIGVEVNGEALENFRADGLIISTPTGSTAYSLAASGPIVHPGANVLIVNPICPQNLNDRPIILPDNNLLRISFEEGEHDILASMDGQDNLRLSGKDVLLIEVSEFKTRLLRLLDTSFYDRVHSKLYDLK